MFEADVKNGIIVHGNKRNEDGVNMYIDTIRWNRV